MTDRITLAITALYALAIPFAYYEAGPAKAVYFLGCTLLMAGVLWMK